MELTTEIVDNIIHKRATQIAEKTLKSVATTGRINVNGEMELSRILEASPNYVRFMFAILKAFQLARGTRLTMEDVTNYTTVAQTFISIGIEIGKYLAENQSLEDLYRRSSEP